MAAGESSLLGGGAVTINGSLIARGSATSTSDLEPSTLTIAASGSLEVQAGQLLLATPPPSPTTAPSPPTPAPPSTSATAARLTTRRPHQQRRLIGDGPITNNGTFANSGSATVQTWKQTSANLTGHTVTVNSGTFADNGTTTTDAFDLTNSGPSPAAASSALTRPSASATPPPPGSGDLTGALTVNGVLAVDGTAGESFLLGGGRSPSTAT